MNNALNDYKRYKGNIGGTDEWSGE
jgi:hypothetical protein